MSGGVKRMGCSFTKEKVCRWYSSMIITPTFNDLISMRTASLL